MRDFDFHEFLGYIAPGMLLLVGVRCLWPDAEKVLPVSGITFGEFGIGVVLAYAAGQLLQTVGNGFEKVWWKAWSGMPTDWIRSGKHDLVAPAQAARIEIKIKRMLSNDSFAMGDCTAKQWYSITRQICAAVSGASRSSRIDVFNGYYGLCRGIAASLLLLIACSLLLHFFAWRVHVALLVLLAMAIYRMHRFGVHYGREVFVQFLEIPEA